MVLINSPVFSRQQITLFGYVKTRSALRRSWAALGVGGSKKASYHGPFVSHRRPPDLSTRDSRWLPVLRRLHHHQLLPAAASGREPCPGQGRSAAPHRRRGEGRQLKPSGKWHPGAYNPAREAPPHDRRKGEAMAETAALMALPAADRIGIIPKKGRRGSGILHEERALFHPHPHARRRQRP